MYNIYNIYISLRFFRGLTHLSVQSCTLFNDKALEAIEGISDLK